MILGKNDMDIIITTNYRPNRLLTVLSTLFLQNLSDEKRLVILDNSRKNICSIKQIDKILKAFKKHNWEVEIYYSNETSISKLKKEALDKSKDEYIALIDNDIMFTRHDTLEKLKNVLINYEVACVSPLGYELDDEHPILNEYAHLYNEVLYDENGVGEGIVALGCFLVIRRSEYLKIEKFYCNDFPYMEDQILVHFLKKNKGYAYLKNHIIYHIGYSEKPTYRFDEEYVIKYLESKDENYKELLKLRIKRKDGAQFSKPIIKREYD